MSKKGPKLSDPQWHSAVDAASDSDEQWSPFVFALQGAADEWTSEVALLGQQKGVLFMLDPQNWIKEQARSKGRTPESLAPLVSDCSVQVQLDLEQGAVTASTLARIIKIQLMLLFDAALEARASLSVKPDSTKKKGTPSRAKTTEQDQGVDLPQPGPNFYLAIPALDSELLAALHATHVRLGAIVRRTSHTEAENISVEEALAAEPLLALRQLCKAASSGSPLRDIAWLAAPAPLDASDVSDAAMGSAAPASPLLAALFALAAARANFAAYRSSLDIAPLAYTGPPLPLPSHLPPDATLETLIHELVGAVCGTRTEVLPAGPVADLLVHEAGDSIARQGLQHGAAMEAAAVHMLDLLPDVVPRIVENAAVYAERACLMQELVQHTGFSPASIALCVRVEAMAALAAQCGAVLDGPRYQGEELGARAMRLRLASLSRAGMHLAVRFETRLGQHLVCALAQPRVQSWSARLHTPIGFTNFLEHGGGPEASDGGCRVAYNAGDVVLTGAGQVQSVPVGSAQFTVRSFKLADSSWQQRILVSGAVTASLHFCGSNVSAVWASPAMTVTASMRDGSPPQLGMSTSTGLRVCLRQGVALISSPLHGCFVATRTAVWRHDSASNSTEQRWPMPTADRDKAAGVESEGAVLGDGVVVRAVGGKVTSVSVAALEVLFTAFPIIRVRLPETELQLEPSSATLRNCLRLTRDAVELFVPSGRLAVALPSLACTVSSDGARFDLADGALTALPQHPVGSRRARFFVVNGDGSGQELLTKGEVDRCTLASETAQVQTQPLTDGTGTRIVVLSQQDSIWAQQTFVSHTPLPSPHGGAIAAALAAARWPGAPPSTAVLDAVTAEALALAMVRRAARPGPGALPAADPPGPFAAPDSAGDSSAESMPRSAPSARRSPDTLRRELTASLHLGPDLAAMARAAGPVLGGPAGPRPATGSARVTTGTAGGAGTAFAPSQAGASLLPYAPLPPIAVRPDSAGVGQVLRQLPLLTLLTSEVDFGSAARGAIVVASVRLRNTGGRAARIRASCSASTVSLRPPATIAPGEEAAIEVKCFVASSGACDVLVDGDGGSFSVPLRWSLLA